jgi:hypothetical protein
MENNGNRRWSLFCQTQKNHQGSSTNMNAHVTARGSMELGENAHSARVNISGTDAILTG